MHKIFLIISVLILVGYDISLAGPPPVPPPTVLDEDNMASDSDTAVPTQQSTKAYVDAAVGAVAETDPIVGAITGIVKANGAGAISAATADTDYLVNIVADTTPQLGGDLDINTHSIVSTSNGDITLNPNGTGDVVISGTKSTLDTDGNLTLLGSGVFGADDDPANITLHSASTITIYDDSDDTTVVVGPVADGTTTLGITGALDVSGQVDAGTLTINSGSITDSSGAISTGDENITHLGNLILGADDDISTVTIHDAGTITMYDDSDDTTVVVGPVSDGTTTLAITGGLDISGNVDAGTITIGSGSVTDSSGAISFVNENLSTTGTLSSGEQTITGDVNILHAAGNGGLSINRYYDDVDITAATSATCELNIPAYAKIISAQLHVKTALAAGETWDAELNDGAQVESISTNLAVDQNTNHNHWSAAVTDAETDIIVYKNSDPGVDSFTAQGTIECTVYAFEHVAWSNE